MFAVTFFIETYSEGTQQSILIFTVKEKTVDANSFRMQQIWTFCDKFSNATEESAITDWFECPKDILK